jgi:Short C-terminal domain
MLRRRPAARTVARTAVVAATATAVAGGVARHHAAKNAPPAPPEAAPTEPAAEPAVDPMDHLPKLGALMEQGVLTEEEFAAQKAKILAQMERLDVSTFWHHAMCHRPMSSTVNRTFL